jgi:acyl-CoA thioesterase-1
MGPMSASAADEKGHFPRLVSAEANWELPDVLLIGDSISIGYTEPVAKLLEGRANVYRPATNCGPTTRGLEHLNGWLGSRDWDAIHFNWGLHDLKFIGEQRQVPLESYRRNMTTLVARLKKTGATLIWCATTPVPEGKVRPRRIPADVVAYNRAAAEVMAEHDVRVNDLYSYALPRLNDAQRPVNVHFTPQGSQKLAEQVAQAIRKALD